MVIWLKDVVCKIATKYSLPASIPQHCRVNLIGRWSYWTLVLSKRVEERCGVSVYQF